MQNWEKRYKLRELWDAAFKHYPEQMTSHGYLPSTPGSFETIKRVLDSDDRQRFVKPTERPMGAQWMHGVFPYRRTHARHPLR